VAYRFVAGRALSRQLGSASSRDREKVRPVTDEFDATAPYYKSRLPYLPGFFRAVAQELHLGPRSRALDLACGQGELAGGLAPLVGEVIAVDRSAAMLRHAMSDGVAGNVQFLQRDLDRGDIGALGLFDVVMIGRAIHWLDRALVLRLLPQLLSPAGAIVVCNSTIMDKTQWKRPFMALRRSWRKSKTLPDTMGKAFFKGSAYRFSAEVVSHREFTWTLDDLFAHSLSFSTSTAAILADPERYRSALRAAVSAFMDEQGKLAGHMVTRGNLFQRSG
jgi:SAM-dependent methyltransferase